MCSCQQYSGPRGPASADSASSLRASDLSTVIQAFLRSGVPGHSVEEVEQLIRKHVIFQKVLALQDKKVIGSGSPEHSW